MASTYLKRTYGSTTNRRTYTWSIWLKRANIGTEHNILSAGNFSGEPYLDARFNTNSTLEWYDYNSGYNFRLVTNRAFRDPNCWYHIVFAVDTTQGTSTNRVKIYVNGVQETSFSTSTYPSQNLDTAVNYSGYKTSIGSLKDNATFSGLMSHVHFIDGTQCLPTVFGETDSTTGEWKIKTSPTVTMGTSGFSVLKDGNTITDQSSNSNDLTLGGGNLTKTEDNPSNVFATLNPLVPDAGSSGLYHGNTQHNVDTANWRTAFSTLGMTTGKYYFEALKQAGTHGHIGIRGVEQSDGSLAGNNDYAGVSSQGWSLAHSGGVQNNNSGVATLTSYADNDYVGVFLDCDNSKLYFSKNGAMMSTTGVSITAGLTYMFAVSGHSTYRWVCNFGNGAFGSTQLTGTTYNGSDGNGIFKYNPNSITLDGSSKSFKSLSTKGLNT